MATFDDAVMGTLIGFPFFGNLLLKMPHTADDTVGTAAVSQSGLTYSPGFFSQLNDEEAVFVVGHEVTHIVLDHLPQLREYVATGIGPDGKPLDSDRLNRAMDYVVNAMCVESGMVLPRKSIIEVCYDPARFPPSMTVPEIYCKLASDEQSGGGGGGRARALDQHDTTMPTTPAVTTGDVLAAAKAAKAAGQPIPGSLQRVVDQLTKPATNPWHVIRRAVVGAVGARSVASWRALHRKMIVRGIGMPTPVPRSAGHVGVVNDTSGSIDQKVLDLFGGHMASIIDTVRPKLVTGFWVDSAVRGSFEAKTGADLRKQLRKGAKGGGGTDMTKGVAAAAAAGCEVIVVLTDGFTPFCPPPKGTQLIWAITYHGTRAPSGTTVHI